MAKHGTRCESVGSRAEVMHGNKHCTSGGLTKKDLSYNKHGRIVSKKKQMLANKQEHLRKAGYSAEKGKFGYVRIPKSDAKKTRKAHKKSKAHKSRKAARKDRK